MAFFHGQRRRLTAVVIPPDFGQSLQPQARNLGSSSPAGIPASQELLPHAGEGEERGSRIHPLAVEFEAPALPPEPGVGFEQCHLMPRTPDQGGRSEPADTTADYDHAAHGYAPRDSAATSCTPPTVPATWGNAMEYLWRRS